MDLLGEDIFSFLTTPTQSPGKEDRRLGETDKTLQAQTTVWNYSQLCWLGSRCKPEKIEVKRPQETVFLNNKTAKCRLVWDRKRVGEKR